MYISFSRILFIIVLSSLYACLEGYLLLCTLSCAITIKTGRKILLWVYWPLSLLGAGLYFYFHYLSGGIRSLFGLASSYWGLFIFIPFFVFADIIIMGNFLVRRVWLHHQPALRAAAEPSAAFNTILNRRVRITALVFAGLTLALGSLSARYAKVAAYSVSVEKPLPEKGLRVILVSDMHIGAMVHKKQLSRLVSKINSLEGDLVLIAGDIIDRDLRVYKDENLNEEFGRINAAMGVFAVTGNHDYFGGNLEELGKQLAAAGVRLLVDEAVLVNNSFYVIGRNDFSSGRRGTGRESLKDLTRDIDNSLLLIAVDHQPVNLDEAVLCGIDLQVSGHTHRGQIWPGLFFTRRIYDHDYGLLYRGKTAVVVTSGSGTWGPPVRIGTRAEIVCIDLKNPGSYNALKSGH